MELKKNAYDIAAATAAAATAAAAAAAAGACGYILYALLLFVCCCWVSVQLGELEGRAAAINKELQQQNAALEYIAEGVHTNNEEMSRQHKQIKQILKR